MSINAVGVLWHGWTYGRKTAAIFTGLTHDWGKFMWKKVCHGVLCASFLAGKVAEIPGPLGGVSLAATACERRGRNSFGKQFTEGVGWRSTCHAGARDHDTQQ
mmetsp:Transcript_39138/g.90757  ORF Transcript_39138/g.90757 Transcript_39138/m.90757 type:complete len:103 (-) Transcript_39138:11-319(-)